MKTKIDNDVAHIIPEENINIINAEELKKEFFNLIDKNIKYIYIDFKNVKKIDNAGLGKLFLFPFGLYTI